MSHYIVALSKAHTKSMHLTDLQFAQLNEHHVTTNYTLYDLPQLFHRPICEDEINEKKISEKNQFMWENCYIFRHLVRFLIAIISETEREMRRFREVNNLLILEFINIRNKIEENCAISGRNPN